MSWWAVCGYLLLSVAALRTGALTRALNTLGVILGIAGILTIDPALWPRA